MSQVETDIQQMQAQIEQYGSVTQFGTQVQVINGPGGVDGNNGFFNRATGGFAESGGVYFDATWQLGNWGDTMKFTPR
jgi:hypothetical protein